MKATNYLVTYDDLSTMSLVPKGTPATGNRIATKSFINSNYYVNQSIYPYDTYASLQCPPYQTIIAGPTNSGTIYYAGTSGGTYSGFYNAAYACLHETGGSVTVYWSGTIGNGTVLYLDPDGINFFYSTDQYYSLGGYSFALDGSTIYNYAACICYSLPYTYTLYYDYDDTLPRVVGFAVPEDACTATNSFTVYSSSSSIGIGTLLYYDYCGTILIQPDTQISTQKNYRIGTDIIQFSDIDVSVASIVPCAPSVGTIGISNTLFGGVITDVTVNGVTITGATLPLYEGNTTSGTTPYLGTYDITVYYSSALSGSSINIYDSASAYTCENIGGSGSVTFYSQSIDNITAVSISAQDGTC